MKKDELSLSTYPRSPEWDKVKRRFKRLHPTCAVCGTRKGLTVHHIVPYHIHPELENEESNLICLCKKHHLTFGHFEHWKSINPSVRVHAEEWSIMIKNRPRPWEII